MVVVHEKLSCRRDFFRRLFKIGNKVGKPLFGAVFVRHAAKTDIAAAEDIVLFDERVGIVQNPFGIAVGQDNGNACAVANFTDLLRLNLFGNGGKLDCFITDVGDFLNGTDKVFDRLCVAADGVELCPCL